MKRAIPILLFTILLSSCNGWVIQPGPTPFLSATLTPSIFTPTPVVIGVTSVTSTPIIATSTATTVPPTFTNTPILLPTNTAIVAPTSTNSPSGPAIAIQVLGCDTSVDVLHGMGEVTNAYVTLKNIGGVPLTNIRATLLARDPGMQAHPDQTVELTSLPTGHQVTIKLTVDTTFRQETPIQVEMTSDQGVFPREGAASCTAIGLFAPNPITLNTPMPSVP